MRFTDIRTGEPLRTSCGDPILQFVQRRGGRPTKRAIVLFTRDLRVHDHPALSAASRWADEVVPLFVFDDSILRSTFAGANRTRFLLDSLEDLDRALRDLGAGLIVRRGEPVDEVAAVVRDVGAKKVFVSEDVSAYARAREGRLRSADVDVEVHPGITVVPPSDISTGSDSEYKVFTPYLRRWSRAPRRSVLRAPRSLKLPSGLARGKLPKLRELTSGDISPDLPAGGETEGRKRLAAWLRKDADDYERAADDLAGDTTSRLSPYLHFGCVSPLEVEERARKRGVEPFVRQLAWRDFYHQAVATHPEFPHEDFRGRGDRWSRSTKRFEAWKAGLTGYPIVDAGMRQLAREGWMHNRARLITASFLVKNLYIDWRLGADHFYEMLVDGDLANNSGNWQWVAGTGHDTRPNRVFNPIRQAHRFDPNGDYVRRYVPELEGLPGASVHEPWKETLFNGSLDYPSPIVDHAETAALFKQRRAG